ncbi:tRNA (adenosine(37)-N6)-threonylcarbamoyltransferase complex ATPase subunit type 1 TsaE [Pseudodesulfovibrio sp.]|uniref:tRNA (adenosine(37)-N6)-threonylcarbamoyltransferase complex ATPase subunit type 1 TsaE n=1 Tax=Pseudodesulfovibrio sp. TaxID=2035812 RepID=UPI00263025FF|nr:tRNA (adenosine(37)-N6)-threonylcarbamoyltransferase complex ATPase subunit type 1 TsaE [Pseudodesulfovibrio sp.]MDD3310896.1 tRNA (adenosine(37)-N6)-threonylcarbamoyltransferase complex ATPase subunit type 1 TsaE [Pseudodesulfovibrio sp.]
MNVTLHLKTAGDTLDLGRILAQALARTTPSPSLLLQGGLGSGKTTLVRGLVESLPGADMAEVSSPSFNIFNLYPTTPQVAHFDLYRLEGMVPDDSLFEYLEDPATLVVVEWIEYLDQDLWPGDAILLRWLPADSGRGLTLECLGETAQTMAEALEGELKPYRQDTQEP